MKHVFPEISARATPLGSGFQALAIDNHDGTITKAYLRHIHRGAGHWNRRAFLRETTALRLLEKVRFDGFAVPRLVEEPVLFEDVGNPGPFVGVFRMTKLKGNSANWRQMHETATKAEQYRHFEEVGYAIGSFQKAVAGLPIKRDRHTEEWGAVIHQSPALSEAENERLVIADAYFRSHKTPGIIHADMYDRNIIVDDKNHITGIIDFGLFGRRSDHQQEIYGIMNYQSPLAASAVKEGFEHATGKTVDPLMVTLARISNASYYLKNISEDQFTQPWQRRARSEMRTLLRRIEGNLPSS